MTPKTQQALTAVLARSGLSTTAIVNRALQIYSYLDPCLGDGEGAVYVREERGGELERLRIF